MSPPDQHERQPQARIVLHTNGYRSSERGVAMPAGVLIVPDRGSANVIDDAVRQARAAFEAGVRQLWLGQQFDYDAITLAAVIGSAVPGMAVGTSVVPINPRHPLVVG